MKILKHLLLLIAIVAFHSKVMGQYFGQNKPTYENFDFSVIQTPNFEIYHYLDNPELEKAMANYTEQWYLMHQNILKDTFDMRNPMILYNNHADFQQTNTISGNVGIGTGGVTEGLRNRVIMPIAMSNQQTFHVLGHELVHAFQYHMVINGDSTSLRNLSNLPLWMVEGLAEYMSIGSIDAHTAMWMRDAVLNEEVPTIKDLNNPKYFPYRYGQAFWAFIAGWRGDEIIEPYFSAVAKYGLEAATKKVIGLSTKELSKLWEKTIKDHFSQFVNKNENEKFGRKLLHEGNAGRINIAPVVSPNGRYLIYLSEKGIFSTDLYLADASSGKTIRKVASSTKDGHIDDFNYIESAGTWSPDSKQFAFVAVSKGRNILVIKDVFSGKTVQSFPIQNVPAFTNPSWSPDGDKIVVAGLAKGQVDLFSVTVKDHLVTQLTNNPYAEMHPSWSPDGNHIWFATDEVSYNNGRTNGRWVFNLSRLDVITGKTMNYEVFPGADNLNPIVDESGMVWFASNRDGFRNLYQLDPLTGTVKQMTALQTGVSGITHYAPSFSVSPRSGRIYYSQFYRGQYTIYRASSSAFLNEMVDVNDVDFSAATLPKLNPNATQIVNAQIHQLDKKDPAKIMLDRGSSVIKNESPYDPKFGLTYLGGGAGVGIGLNNTFGTNTGLAGGVDMLFSDILGHSQLFTSLSLNGEITDFGGIVGWVNRKNRIQFGAAISHIPFRQIGGIGLSIDSLQVEDGILPVQRVDYDILRRFEDRIEVFGQLPVSKSLRFESGASFSRFSFRRDLNTNYYSLGGVFIGEDRQKLDAPGGFNLGTVNLAFVGDRSQFGITAPMNGYRFRFEVEKYFGDFNFSAITADVRLYKYMKPLSLAYRVLHYGRYGGNDEMLTSLYAGNPWYVRGYDFNATQDAFFQAGKDLNTLFGNKLLVSNFEVRIPFSGPERLSLIKSKFLFTDLNFFVDGGLAWNSFDQFKGADSEGVIRMAINPIFSVGASVRVNLFGAMIIEPFYAIPIQENLRGSFGVNFIPGW